MTQPFHTVQSLRFSGDSMELTVDGRTHTFAIAAISPRLAKASAKERADWRVTPSGYGLHWPLLDEDLAIDGLLRLAGLPSGPAAAMVHEPPTGYGR